MEGRFSSGPATVLGARVAGHACTARVNSTKAHSRRDDDGGSQCGGVSAHLLSQVELPGKCDPGLAHPAESGYESWVCERASSELGTGQTTGGIGEAPGSFASTGGRVGSASPARLARSHQRRWETRAEPL